MKNIKKILGVLGFVRQDGDVYSVRVGRLHHIVYLARARSSGGVIVGVCVHHTIFPDGDDWYMSPIEGPVSPRGIGSSWVWDDRVSAEEVQGVLRMFFSAFLDERDVLNALTGYYVAPFFAPAIDALKLGGVAPEAVRGGIPAYEIKGGLRTRTAVRSELAVEFGAVISSFGMAISEMDDLVAIRERLPGVFDCVRVVFDNFSTIYSVRVFNWVAENWIVDDRLKGEFHAFNGLFVQESGRTKIGSTIGGVRGAFQEWLMPINEGLAQISGVFDVNGYIDTLNDYGLLVRDKLVKHLASRTNRLPGPGL